MKNFKFWAAVNSEGKAFAGVSSLSGRAMWFLVTGDLEFENGSGVLKFKRDGRWLAQAKKWDATAEWKSL